MRRRQFLAATAGTALVPVAAGRPRSRASSTSFAPLGRLAIPGITETVVGDDGATAYAAVTDGFATVDVSDPSAPALLAERRDVLGAREDGPLGGIWDVKVDGDRLLVVGPANPRAGAVAAAVVYDVADPAAPERLGVHETTYPIHNSYLRDGVAYLTENGGDGVGLATVSVGPDPERLGGWSLTDHDPRWADVPFALANLHDVYVQDGLAYLAHWDAGTWIVDVEDPANPSFLARVRGRPVDKLASYSQRGARRDGLRKPGNDHYVAVNDAGDLLGIGIEAWYGPGPGGIELYDVSDPRTPDHLARIDPPPVPEGRTADYHEGVWTTAHNFEFDDDRLYSAWYQGGVRVFDVADPEHPTEVAAWSDTDEACFWTARTATDCVVAPSSSQPPALDIEERLYTFPDPGSDGPSPDGDATPTGTATTTGRGPGFGLLAGLAGLGVGVWQKMRSN